MLAGSYDFDEEEDYPPLTVPFVDRALDEVRPYLIADGGNVEVVEVEDGIVKLRLQGACGTCASSTATMKMGIERSLMVCSCAAALVDAFRCLQAASGMCASSIATAKVGHWKAPRGMFSHATTSVAMFVCFQSGPHMVCQTSAHRCAYKLQAVCMCDDGVSKLRCYLHP